MKMLRATTIFLLVSSIVAVGWCLPLSGKYIEANPELNPDLFEGDILGVDPKNAIRDPTRLWPGGVIYYSIDADLSDLELNTLNDALAQYESKTCLTFKVRTTEANYVSIQKTGSGCSSYVGMIGGAQRMSLDPSCFRNGVPGTVIHEFMHASGFYHEQSRTDRDDYIFVNYDNIQPGKEGNFNKYSQDVIFYPGDAQYDYGSVLHYSQYGFAIDPTIPTIYVPENVTIGQREGFSPIDLYKINALYNCNV